MQLVRQPMDVIFAKQEMAESSVTSRSSNKKPGLPPKKALDAAKVAALLCKLPYPALFQCLRHPRYIEVAITSFVFHASYVSCLLASATCYSV